MSGALEAIAAIRVSKYKIFNEESPFKCVSTGSDFIKRAGFI